MHCFKILRFYYMKISRKFLSIFFSREKISLFQTRKFTHKLDFFYDRKPIFHIKLPSKVQVRTSHKILVLVLSSMYTKERVCIIESNNAWIPHNTNLHCKYQDPNPKMTKSHHTHIIIPYTLHSKWSLIYNYNK